MKSKEITAWSGRETGLTAAVADAVKGWMRRECRWLTRLERAALGDDVAEATTNGAMLAEANLAASVTLTAALAESLSVIGLAAMVLWVAVSLTLTMKGGRR